MSTTGDLVNLTQLTLLDTFDTWINRTNQIIAHINPLQVYDVVATNGLSKQSGISGSSYNGVITLGVEPGPGVGYRTYTDGKTYTIVDFSKFTPFGLGATSAAGYFVQNTDEFLFNAVNDYSGGGSASGNPATSGTVKKVLASKMLPPLIDLSLITFAGDVSVNGNLTVNGANSFIAANNLQVQDKQIELANQQAITITLTGATANNFVAGTTAFYFTDNSSLTASKYGFIQSYTGTVAGPTANMVIGYPFSSPDSASSFLNITGFFSNSSTGTNRREIVSTSSVQNSFLNDSNLSEAGIVARGASSDKTLLWIYQDTDSGLIYNAWTSNQNFAVQGNTNSIISRMFRSFGYDGINQSQYIFAAEPTKNTEIYLSTLNDSSSDPLQLTGGTWKIVKNANRLEFSYGVTGLDNTTSLFNIWAGASGTTYSGVTATNYAHGLNADLLDGAHGTTLASPYSIPVADAYGRIYEDWFNAGNLRKRITQSSHGLTGGDIVRVNSSGNYVKAKADTAENAEAIGIVSEYHSTNQFTVTYKGRISGLSGSIMTAEQVPFVTGSVYFMSGITAGLLIADPDYSSGTRLSVGQIKKPMLLATSQSEGFVLGYPGAKLPTPTDQLYLPGLVPVGTIQSYAGNLSHLTSEWLLCDGDRYLSTDYPHLYDTISNTYKGTITFTVNGSNIQNGAIVQGGTRNLQNGDIITVAGSNGTVSDVNSSAGTITVTFSPGIAFSAATYTFIPNTNSSGQKIFFVPDLRTRSVIGGSTGSSYYNTVGLTSYSAGQFGGNEVYNLSGIATPSSGTSYYVLQSSNNTADLHTPYLVTHYIIRAKRETDATILTGHNHDSFYPRLDGTNPAFVKADFRAVLGVAATADTVYKSQPEGAVQTIVTGLNVYSGLTADRFGATFANIVTSLTAANINGTNGRIESLTASSNLSVPNTASIGSLTATNVSVTTKITVPTPTSSNDATTKDYVDNFTFPIPTRAQFNSGKDSSGNYGGIDGGPRSLGIWAVGDLLPQNSLYFVSFNCVFIRQVQMDEWRIMIYSTTGQGTGIPTEQSDKMLIYDTTDIMSTHTSLNVSGIIKINPGGGLRLHIYRKPGGTGNFTINSSSFAAFRIHA